MVVFVPRLLQTRNLTSHEKILERRVDKHAVCLLQIVNNERNNGGMDKAY